MLLKVNPTFTAAEVVLGVPAVIDCGSNNIKLGDVYYFFFSVKNVLESAAVTVLTEI